MGILKFTENLEAGLQRFVSLQRRDKGPMDISPAGDPLTRIQLTLDAVLADQRNMGQAIDQSISQWEPQHILTR